jgi:uncharacterized protein (TIGR02646 family)
MCSAHDAGVRKFVFKKSIYSAPEVKNALRSVQHEKCAFCESVFSHVDFGDVEHFRPKAGHKQRATDPLTTPGYYWLAYKWSNLFCSCSLCNQRFKGNLFPLSRPKSRARDHHADIHRERPLLINPGRDDPHTHLEFRAERVEPVDGSRVGRTTIEVLGLNRPELLDFRRNRLDTFLALLEARQMLLDCLSLRKKAAAIKAQVERLDEQIRRLTADTAEYAAMMRAAERVVSS